MTHETNITTGTKNGARPISSVRVYRWTSFRGSGQWVHAGGGHSPRPGSTLSPSDQRQAGEISPNPERRLNQVPYEVVQDLEAAIRDFVEFYNYRRYHQALRVVTPADVLEGRLEAILAHRKEVQRETFDRRRRYNQEVRETLKPGASSP